MSYCKIIAVILFAIFFMCSQAEYNEKLHENYYSITSNAKERLKCNTSEECINCTDVVSRDMLYISCSGNTIAHFVWLDLSDNQTICCELEDILKCHIRSIRHVCNETYK